MDYSSLDYSTYSTTTSTNPISSLISLAICVISIIGLWKIFTKAGEKGWKAIIPIYSSYILFKISGKKFVGYLVATIILIIAYFVMMVGSVGMIAGGLSGSAEAAGGMAVVTGIASIVVLVCAIIVLVIHAKLCGALSRSFGHGGGFAAGLFFLSPIFYMILGFNQDQYLGPNGGGQQ